MTTPAPILIVGQGLAGTAVAWQLRERGVPFLIVDPNEAGTCSKVAAGLVTPITGKRLNLSWRIPELLPEAREFYRRVGARLGGTFYHETPLLRLFKEPREVEIWKTRSLDEGLQPWIEPSPPQPLMDDSVFNAELGGFQQRHAGWLDTASYLEASRCFFAELHQWEQGQVEESALAISADEVRWNDRTFSNVIFCKGWQQEGSRFFDWFKFNSARGVILSLRADIDEQRILTHRCWLQPRGNGEWRAGSTYDFDFDSPIDYWVNKMKTIVSGFLRAPFEVTEERVGIRPIVKNRQIVLGRHPAHPRVAVLAGLGSKGTLRAPTFSRMLVEHLLTGSPIDAEVDVASND